MGAVHRACDRVLDRTVAVKLLPAALADDRLARERFAREARSAAALSHPNIVAVYDCRTGGDVPFIVMEYVDGESLAALLLREGRVDPARAARLGAQVAGALAAAHRRGIVHRDVKPANVMLARSDEVKLLDFGIASGQWVSSLTQTGFVLGSFRYLSPEVARGERAQAASDVYALGCVLYELLTGRPPFTGETAAAVLQQHLSAVPRRAADRAGVPAELDALTMQMLAKRPAERPAADALAARLERAAARPGARRLPRLPAALPPPTGAIRIHGRGRRARALVWGLAAAALAAAALALVGVLSAGGAGRRAPGRPAATREGARSPFAGESAALSAELSGFAAAASAQLQPAPAPEPPLPPVQSARHRAHRPHGNGHGRDHGKGDGGPGPVGNAQQLEADGEAEAAPEALGAGGTEAPAPGSG
jgi:serine/threonine-protein kinase